MSNQTRIPSTALYAVLGSICLAPLSSYAQDAAGASSVAGEDEEVVYLAPFEVSADDNTGYVASNSISGTRSQTPIREIPINIQVFTKDFAQDLMLTSQVDMEKYNASLVNGGADTHSTNVIQQAYNGFLFRGFIQNWSLRDGVRCYDPVDGQGISRVEIVKGPAAAFYGVTYPGGVMNVITKSAMLNTSFTDAAFTLSDYGEWRTTLDTNISASTKMGEVAVRYNGAYAQTLDDREHSEGKMRFNQVAVTMNPFKGTTIKLLYEDGYRESPTALGYYTKDEVAADGTNLSVTNGASIPLQEVFKDIGYKWNWSLGNMRSVEDKFYKAEITQSFGDYFSINAYAQYLKRVQIDSDGLDANGSSGAGSWDCNSNTGWINRNTPSLTDDYLAYQYHYIDWRNQDRAMGITAVGHFDIADVLQNTITAGAHGWFETFYSHRGAMPSDSANYVRINIAESFTGVTNQQLYPPADYFWNVTSGNHERSQNEYYFAAWQGSFLDNRARLTAAVNYTDIELKSYANWSSTVLSNVTKSDKVSPMFGGMFDITKDISVYLIHASSLFPTTTKDSFDNQMPPIEGKSWEAGIKFDLFGNKLSGTLSFYQIKQTGGYQRDANASNANQAAWDRMTDAQRIAAYGTADPAYRSQIRDREGQYGDYVAGEEQESKGVELDLAYQPMSSLQILFSYAHNTVEITDSVNKANIGNIPTNGQIKDQFSLVTKCGFDEGALKGAFVGLGCQYAGKSFQGYYSDVARYYPSTFYMEIFAGYKFKTLGSDSTIQLNVKNITGQEAFVGWQATGSSSVIATTPYKVDVPVRVNLTYRISF